MKLQPLLIDFAPDARPLPRHLVFLDHVVPAALAAAALFFLTWLLRD
jgi:hypothetical protein